MLDMNLSFYYCTIFISMAITWSFHKNGFSYSCVKNPLSLPLVLGAQDYLRVTSRNLAPGNTYCIYWSHASSIVWDGLKKEAIDTLIFTSSNDFFCFMYIISRDLKTHQLLTTF